MTKWQSTVIIKHFKQFSYYYQQMVEITKIYDKGKLVYFKINLIGGVKE